MSIEISNKYVLNWLGKLRDYWCTKNIDGAVSLFSRCTEYQESPFKKCATSFGEIQSLWSEIESQSEIVIKYTLLCVCHRTATVSYDATFIDNGNYHHSNGVYVITFDDEGNCTIFKQWFMIDEV